MTTKKTAPVTVTVLRSGLSVPFRSFANRIALRGEVITLTPEQYEDTLDRHGNSWTTMTDAAQEARWGEVKFALGDHSEGIAHLGDDVERIRFLRRERDVLEARRIPGDADRREAFKKINETYGASSSTQRTMSYTE